MGQPIFLWNIITSWLEGKLAESGDPWELAHNNLGTRERDWFEQNWDRMPVVADSGSDAE